MAVFRPTYRDKKTGQLVESGTWWFSFRYAGKRIRESAKTTRKTLAVEAEKNRRLELERGYNGLDAGRKTDRIRTISELADAYLAAYKERHKSYTFAQYALDKLKRHLGGVMMVDVSEKTVLDYQTARLKEKASPKSINEEVGFLLRLVDHGDLIRAKLRKTRSLKLRESRGVGRAFTPEEKAALIAAAKAARSPVIYPALMLALNAGLRDAEIRTLQWERVDLSRAFLVVGEAKTEAGEGRTIPLNSALLEALVDYAKWYTKRFGMIRPEWYVFPFGKPRPNDPTRPMVTLKTAWTNVKKVAGVKGRWHDNRHTLITDLAEQGVGDQTIMDIAGHVSKQMLKHYSHIRMQAKRSALEALVSKGAEAPVAKEAAKGMAVSVGVAKEMAKVTVLN